MRPSAAPLAALLAACGGPPPALPRPACDVLLISLDTTRADVLTFADPALAPNLTALAARGVVFEQAFAGSSWTLPSHVELFTGLPPILHGVHDDTLAIDPLHPTLGELLDARGAFTAGAWSAYYLAGAYGFERGFDRWECALAADPEADRRLADALSRGGSSAYWAGDQRTTASQRLVSGARVAERIRAAIGEARPAEPLALFAHFFDPHYDFVPPPPFDTRFDPDYQGDLDGRDYWRNPRIFDVRLESPRVISDRDLEHIRALYAGEIAWCDEQIGTILDALREAGRLEDTLVVVTADHGEEFFEHGNRGHRQTLYDEVLRVPLLVVPPHTADDRARRGTRVPDQVSLADVLPTVLDYVGGPPPPRLWGRSLRPRIEGAELPPRPLVATLGMEARGGELHLLEAWRTVGGKLVRRVRLFADGSAAEIQSVELFDLAEDPREGLNRAPDRPHLARTWARAEATLAELRAFAAGLPRSPPERRRTDVRDVFEGELSALGYAGDGPDEVRDARWPQGPLRALPLPEE